MLVIRDDQLDTLHASARSQFEMETLAHLARFYPDDAVLLGETGLLAVIHDAEREATALRLDTVGDLRRFVTLRLVLGSGFLRDPLLPWAARIAADSRGEPGMVDRLAAEAADYLELTSGEDGQHALRAVLRAGTLKFEDEFAELTDDAAMSWALPRRVWPQKYRMLQPERRDAYLTVATKAAAAIGLDTPGTTRLYVLLMFLLGAEFATDPALPWASHALAMTSGEQADVRARALFEAGLNSIARLRETLRAAEI